MIVTQYCVNALLYRTQRHCSKTVKIGDITIPKGANVTFPINVIHHMTEYWPDPYTFDPERYRKLDVTV